MPYRIARPCPGCGGTFSIHRGEEFAYEKCESCCGVWISWVMLLAMADELDPGHELMVNTTTKYSGRMCPECKSLLSNSLLFEVPVDCCLGQKHGVFFDRDELISVLVQIASENDNPQRPTIDSTHVDLPAFDRQHPQSAFRSLLSRLFG